MTDLKSTTTSGSTVYEGSLNITNSGTGELTRDHLELIKVYNDSYYINQDTFSYLLVLTVVGILLMKTVIKIFSISMQWGFYLNNKKQIGKK